MVQRELTPEDYITMLRRRWVLIVVLALIGPPLAYGVSRFLPEKFKSQTLVLIQQPTVSSDIVKSLDSTDLNQRLASMQQQILSRSRLEPIIRQYNLYPEDVNRKSMDDLVLRLQKAIDVTPVADGRDACAATCRDSTVAVTMDNARNAQEVCTAVTSMFIEESLRLATGTLRGTTQFLAQATGRRQVKSWTNRTQNWPLSKAGILVRYRMNEQTNLNLLTV